ncbi:RNA polymerase sigma factor [Cohnella terricola]|uniref:Sigma-70 family RNA polymerase sigma factor n=1 Tax=Cohnella terricola TaxID=1289167 RepID=A0A559JIL9_9BACL|nr:sigma-70 family RNA polymerase sigma factor [Cohnella terricola]TVX99719.1 sigma-70 family RNA polymerase sigma factor [Cohnella terricola]
MEIEELSDLVKRHGKAIYSFCRVLAANRADADDLYQETFLKAVEKREQLDASRNPKGFLLSIAVGLRRNHRRKFAWRQRIAPMDELAAADDRFDLAGGATPEETAISRELRDRIRDAADGLGDKLKIPLYLFYTADMSVDEIASALQIPVGTVKSRLHQARRTMKEKLEAELL